MKPIQFEWDEPKNQSNLAKHRVSFEEAETVFLDEWALMMDDPDPSRDEERFMMLGLSAQIRVLVVSFCYRQQDQIIRIISARKATKHEQRQYTEAR